MDKYTVLSLGWGVQSFTLAAMAALGDIEKPDVCIHADTGHEVNSTYIFRYLYEKYLFSKKMDYITVMNEHQRPIVDKWGGVRIPAYTITPKGNGQIHRQCTGEWKIQPLRQYIQKHRNKKPVEMWIGISTDEYLRMKDSDVKYITNRYPLIEMKMSRKDCENWLINNRFDVPNKSACTFCPYHSTSEWRDIKECDLDWHEAVSVDREIRKVRPPYDLFVHPSRKPLEEVDFRTMEEKGQMRLWDEECTGLCGV